MVQPKSCSSWRPFFISLKPTVGPPVRCTGHGSQALATPPHRRVPYRGAGGHPGLPNIVRPREDGECGCGVSETHELESECTKNISHHYRVRDQLIIFVKVCSRKRFCGCVPLRTYFPNSPPMSSQGDGTMASGSGMLASGRPTRTLQVGPPERLTAAAAVSCQGRRRERGRLMRRRMLDT